MIELDKDESMLLLLTKSWEHIEHQLPRYKNGKIKKGYEDVIGSLEYIQACCNIYCFGQIYSKAQANVWAIYQPLFEKLLTAKQVIEAYQETAAWDTTMLRSLLTQLAILQVGGKIKLDYSLVRTEGNETLMRVNGGTI